MSKTTINTPLFVLPAAILVTGAIFWLSTNPMSNRFSGDANIWRINVEQERSRLRKAINSSDPRETYQLLKEEYNTASMDAQHIVGHLFGEIMFEEGIGDSIAICDSAFQFGCYHGYTFRHILAHGIDSVRELDAACRRVNGQQDGQCQHGLGHGIVEYYNITNPERLNQAAEICDRYTNSNGVFSECVMGVYMAYREQLSLSGNTFKVQFAGFKKDNPYSPCAEADSRSRGICYSSAGIWLHVYFAGDYRKIGGYCNGVSLPEDRDLCFFGVGLFAATAAEYNFDKTVEKCDQIPERGRFMCFTGAYISAKGYNSAEAKEYCHYLHEESSIYRCLDTEPYILYEKAAKAGAHHLNHILGMQSYENLAAAGIELCGKSGGYGCYHGFFQKAALTGSPENLLSECMSADSSKTGKIECAHGFGHGLLIKLGDQHIESAIGQCTELVSRLEAEMCVNGVLMEYRYPLSKNDGQAAAIDSKNIYKPCESLETHKYQTLCYGELPYWWLREEGGNDKRSIERCRDIANVENRKGCFSGLGKYLPMAFGFMSQNVERYCSSIEEAGGHALCIESAAMRTSIDKTDLSLCDTLNQAYHNGCRQNVTDFICINFKRCTP